MNKFALSPLFLLALSAAPVGGMEKPEPFCQRLAAQLGLKLVSSGANSNEQVWSTDTASFGMHLFGGAAATSISLTPIDDTDDSGFLSMDEACTYTKMGVKCRIEGPAHLRMRTRREKAALDALAGERAEVEIRNTKVVCKGVI